MAKLQHIKKQIALIQELQRITNTMKTISAARWRMGKSALKRARTFGEPLRRVLQILGPQEPFPEKQELLLLGIFPDRGLVGGFSEVLARGIHHFLEEKAFSEVKIILLGTQGKRALKMLEKNVVAFHPLPVHRVPHYRDVRELTYEIFKRKEQREFTHFYVGFMQYISVSEHKPFVEQFLPFSFPQESAPLREQYLFLSDERHLYHSLLFEYVAGKLYQALAESFMSEQAARLILMDRATVQAQETLKELTLLYAKKRQEKITQELNEVTSAAEAFRTLE